MSVPDVQVWVGLVGALLTAVLGIIKYFNYVSKRDRIAAVGASFRSNVDSLASENETQRMAAAVLLRRFFDPDTEQGAAGRPYLKETIELIAGMLRVRREDGVHGEQPEQDQPEQREKREAADRLHKVLADGLRYAVDLRRADLQRCNLRDAYLGVKTGDWGGDTVDLSDADLFEADLSRASLRQVDASRAVFYHAICEKTVFAGATLAGADFRSAKLAGANFTGATLIGADFRGAWLAGANFAGAHIGGARFEGAHDVPEAVAALLDERQVARPRATVGEPVTTS